jgi:hypothetical protein
MRSFWLKMPLKRGDDDRNKKLFHNGVAPDALK